MGSPVVHFEINTRKAAELSDFYSKAFGWHVDSNNPMNYGMVDTHGGPGGINGGINTVDEAFKEGVTVYILVPDVQAALDKVESSGGATLMPVTEIPDTVTFALFTDPAGHAIGLVKDEGRAPEVLENTSGHPVVHFEINSRNASDLHKFYAEVFGWHIDTNNPMNYGIVDTHGGPGGINGGIGQAQEPDQEWVTIYVQAADPQAALDKAESLGAKTLMPVTDLGMVTIALFADPAGNRIGIVKEGDGQ